MWSLGFAKYVKDKNDDKRVYEENYIKLQHTGPPCSYNMKLIDCHNNHNKIDQIPVSETKVSLGIYVLHCL